MTDERELEFIMTLNDFLDRFENTDFDPELIESLKVVQTHYNYNEMEGPQDTN